MDRATVATFSRQAAIGAPLQNQLGSIFLSHYNFVVDLAFPEMSAWEFWPTRRISEHLSTD